MLNRFCQDQKNGDELADLLSYYPKEVRDSIMVILKNIDPNKS